MDGGSKQDSKASVDSAKKKTQGISSDADLTSEFLENARKRRDFEKKVLIRKLQILTEECDALKKECKEDAVLFKELVLKIKAFERESRKQKSDEESGPRKQLRVKSGHSSLTPNKFIPSTSVTNRKYVSNGHALQFFKATSNAERKVNIGANGVLKLEGDHSALKSENGSPSLPAPNYGLNGHGFKFLKTTSNGIINPGVSVKVENGNYFESVHALLKSEKITPLPPVSKYERNGLDLSSEPSSNGIDKTGDAGIRYDNDGIFKVPTGSPYLPIRK